MTIFASSGVPQGSHLGPVLFCIFINDLADSFHFATPLFYADDLKLFSRINSFDDARNLQCDLGRLTDWCSVNRLSLNLSKCQVMRISQSFSSVSYAYYLVKMHLSGIESVCDLGVTWGPFWSMLLLYGPLTKPTYSLCSRESSTDSCDLWRSDLGNLCIGLITITNHGCSGLTSSRCISAFG